MGEVYRARSLAAAGVVKELCVKRISPERLQNETAVQRFINEARVAAMMSHSNVVSVFDFGRSGEEFFLAMEWVDGVDLRDAIHQAAQNRVAFAMHEAAYIAGSVARALAYAHAMDGGGVVHGDLKPANVLLSKDGNVKLTDFGAAATAGSSIVAGTPEYMAPESGKGSKLHPASDLFALGVMLKEMLCLDRGASIEKATTQVDSWADERCRQGMAGLLAEMTDDDLSARTHSARDVASRLEAIASYGRASGAPAPVDAVAQRVASQRDERRPDTNRPTGATLDADVSFARDGLADLATKMTLPTLDAPSMAPARESSTKDARDATDLSHRSAATHHEGAVSLLGVPTSSHDEVRSSTPHRKWTLPSLVLVALAVSTALFVAAPWRTENPTTDRPSPPTSAEVKEQSVAVPNDKTADEGSASAAVSRPLDGESTHPSYLATPERAQADATDEVASAPTPVERVRSPAKTRTPRPRASPIADSRKSAQTTSGPASGTVHINALPWAEVFIDGKRVGTTPLLHHRLAAGEHRVTLVNDPLGARQEQRVEVVADGEQRIIVDLRSR